MTSAKDIRVAPIGAADARAFVRAHHYSGKVDPRSQLHLGAFIGARLVGVAQFGPPMDRSKLVGLVRDTPWQGMTELNRLALIDDTPRNTESRFLAVCFRLIRQEYPHLQWVVSFADATQCGDGTIYRAAGFVLTGIKRNTSIWRMPDGNVVASIVFEPGFSPNAGPKSLKARYGKTGGESSGVFLRAVGAMRLPGFQLRYIYFLDPTARGRLTVPVLPFTKIAEMGASMYLGQPRASEASSDAPAIHAGEGGAAPTLTLQQ